MSFMLKGVTVLGLLFLVHGIYSAYEHSLISARFTKPQSTDTIQIAAQSPLPLDISIETLIGTLFLLVSIVYSASPLRPIRWSEWAGKIEREGWDPSTAGTEHERKPGESTGGQGNPYRALEDRRGFWDVRTARKEFADWVRRGETNQNGTARMVK